MNRTAYVFLLVTALFWGGNAVAGQIRCWSHLSDAVDVVALARWLFYLLRFQF